ncbi:MAG: YhgE/Pip domain-containing protein [Clostridiales bacterium]|nr:YhgE/Pip domain-containing protein [Clostridiales bacterium]
MRKYKIVISAAVICAIITAALTGIMVTAEAPPVSADSVATAGSYSSSEEVVYALLGNDGAVNNVWVVGTLDVESPGNVKVFGDLTELKNLTTTDDIGYSDGELTINAGAGRFYWQGALRQKELPWNVAVTYFLNGAEVSASGLAGASGGFEMRIETSQNKNFDEVFFKNYMLQVTVTLDTAKCKNIVAAGATAANAGSDKTLAFTVMPDTNGSIGLSADVTNFELESIAFAAVPFSMDIDIGDLSEYTSDFAQLADAITELNDGVQMLRDGAEKLSDGAGELADGSAEYRSGLTKIASGSAELKSGSEAIVSALGELGGGDMSSLTQLPAALRQMAGALKEISSTLETLSGGYSQALAALDGAIAAIPEADIAEADLYALHAANPGNKTVDALVANYQSAQAVKGTYATVSDVFTGVDTALPELKSGVSQVSVALTLMANRIESGLGGADTADMASQYMQFHSGLVSYIDGVVALAEGYSALHSGISEFADGVTELRDGVNELADGMDELDGETSQLPDKIDEMADELVSEYTGGDFEPVSFLSDKNDGVELVQFVFRTDAIKAPDKAVAPEKAAEEQTFWTRLANLFR